MSETDTVSPLRQRMIWLRASSTRTRSAITSIPASGSPPGSNVRPIQRPPALSAATAAPRGGRRELLRIMTWVKRAKRKKQTVGGPSRACPRAPPCGVGVVCRSVAAWPSLAQRALRALPCGSPWALRRRQERRTPADGIMCRRAARKVALTARRQKSSPSRVCCGSFPMSVAILSPTTPRSGSVVRLRSLSTQLHKTTLSGGVIPAFRQ